MFMWINWNSVIYTKNNIYIFMVNMRKVKNNLITGITEWWYSHNKWDIIIMQFISREIILS